MDEYGEKVKEMLSLVDKNGEKNELDNDLFALRASTWLFMVVGELMTMTIL